MGVKCGLQEKWSLPIFGGPLNQSENMNLFICLDKLTFCQENAHTILLI